MSIQVNTEKLVWAAIEAIDDYNQYRQHYGKKKYYQMTEKEQDHGNWLNKNSDKSDKAVSTLCEVLGINYKKLTTIARLVKKWEEKCKWELCFPFNKCEKQILKYLEEEG